MRLPKFWKDKGGWNDKVITVGIVLAIGGGVALSYHYRSVNMALASIILGPIIGFIVGLIAVLALCKLFGKD